MGSPWLCGYHDAKDAQNLGKTSMTRLANPLAFRQEPDLLVATSGFVPNELADYATSLGPTYGGKPSASSGRSMQRSLRIEALGLPPAALRLVVEKLNSALALPRNWDSYG